MRIDPTFTKIFAGIASHEFMFELLNLPPDCSEQDRMSGQGYAGQWFEIHEASFETMLEVLPPIFMRSGMFAMSELKAGTVGSVFFEIAIAGRKRWFHGYCDLSDRAAPDAMRAAIILWETGDTTGMTRDQLLEAVWSFTLRDARCRLGEMVASDCPEEHRTKRMIRIWEPGTGTILKELDALTDEEIAAKLPDRPLPTAASADAAHTEPPVR